MCVEGHQHYDYMVENCPYTCSEGSCEFPLPGNDNCQDTE